MNIFDFEILLIRAVAGVVSLTFFIYFGHFVLDFLKIPAPRRTTLKRQISMAEASNSGKERRKMKSKPGIICSLPIHQESRQDAPLF